MKIIYHCFGGSHSSVTSAAIHLNLLAKERLPRGRDLMMIPYFDRQVAGEHGIFRMMGQDATGNEVYVVGRRNLREFEQLIRGLVGIIGVRHEDFMLVNSMPCVNWVMKVGGFISRCLHLVWLGRPIVIWGTRRMFPRHKRLVDEVKTDLASWRTADGSPGGAAECR